MYTYFYSFIQLWNIFHQPDIVETVLKKTLSDLQVEYLDLYLIHWPMAFKVSVLCLCLKIPSIFVLIKTYSKNSTT